MSKTQTTRNSTCGPDRRGATSAIFQAPRAYKDLKVLRASRESKALKERSDLLAPRVRKVIRAIRATKDPSDLRDLRVYRAFKVQMDLKVRRESKDLRVFKESKALREKQVLCQKE